MTFHRFYRYDFAVTKILVDEVSKYHGIVVSAHILSYAPRSVVQILNETRKPFFIDPMTFVFARDIKIISKDGKIRKSYIKLLEDYGAPFSNVLSGINLIPSDFKISSGEIDDSIVTQACRRVLECQIDKCVVSSDFSKYERLLKKGISPRTVSPTFLVAPYFYANRYNDDWYKISLKFARVANELKGDHPLYPVICISSNILWDESQIRKIIEDYEGFDGYLIWINNFDERSCSTQEMQGLRTLIEGLSSYAKPIYSLYGGYLSDLLSKFGLNGYSSGICYGEKRSVDTVGGGAGNRYYIPTVHLKISEDLANAFFAKSDNNRRLMCSCPTCTLLRDPISNSVSTIEYVDAFFTSMDFFAFRRHFVDVKFLEMKQLETSTIDDVVSSLKSDIKEISTIDEFSGQPNEIGRRHLSLWLILFA